MGAAPLAGRGDVAARWEGYSEEMADRADALLADASARLRAEMARARVAVDPGDAVQADNLRAVCASMVARAMASSAVADGAPVSQWTQTATPYSTSYIFPNPSGDLYLTRQERRSLGLTGGRAGCARVAWGEAGHGD